MSNESAEKKTVLQRVLDDMNFILMLGLVVPTVFYTLWGVMMVASIPAAR
ncbi:MAG: hypothetical protein OEV35_00305 [Gallionellaceae bacterium]|nr:hypothetical protein [Gallionellaceae bacterium]